MKQYVSDLAAPFEGKQPQITGHDSKESNPMAMEGIQDNNKMLYGAAVRCLVSAGQIKDIILSNEDNSCILIRARDIPGRNGIKVNGMDIPVLCDKDISYKGQIAALVLSDSEEKAAAAAKRATVVLSPFDAPYLPLLHQKPFSASNKAIMAVKRIATGVFEKEDKKAIEELFSGGDTKVIASNSVLSFSDADCFVHETSGALCVYSASSSGNSGEDSTTYTILCPASSTPRLRSALCRVLGVSGEEITVQVTARHDEEVDYQTDITAVLAALGAKITGCSVRLMLTREEDSKYNQSAVAMNIKQTAAVMNGKIIALKVLVEADIGAYNPFASEAAQRIAQFYLGKWGAWDEIPLDEENGKDEEEKKRKHTLTVQMSDLYEVPNMFVLIRATASNRPPTSLCEKSLDTMSMQGIEGLIAAINDGIRRYMIYGKRRLPPADVIKRVAMMSDFSRKTQVAKQMIKRSGKRHLMGMFVLCSQEITAAAVAEVETNIFLTEQAKQNPSAIKKLNGDVITHIWLAIEKDKKDDNAGDEEEIIRLSAEKCAAHFDAMQDGIMGNADIDDNITISFVDAKTKSTSLEKIDFLVYGLCNAAIDAAQRAGNGE